MFPTTNRVPQFDEAILSRIHLMLRYDGLSRDARNQIWGHFLSRATTSCGEAVVTDKELEHLVSNNFNGMQVRLPHIIPRVRLPD